MLHLMLQSLAVLVQQPDCRGQCTCCRLDCSLRHITHCSSPACCSRQKTAAAESENKEILYFSRWTWSPRPTSTGTSASLYPTTTTSAWPTSNWSPSPPRSSTSFSKHQVLCTLLSQVQITRPIFAKLNDKSISIQLNEYFTHQDWVKMSARGWKPSDVLWRTGVTQPAAATSGRNRKGPSEWIKLILT